MVRKSATRTIQHLPLTQFRQHVGEVINRVNREKHYVIVERGGLPVAAIMNIDEFEDYLEVREAEAEKDIVISRADIAAGRVRSADLLLAELEAEDSNEDASTARRAS